MGRCAGGHSGAPSEWSFCWFLKHLLWGGLVVHLLGGSFPLFCKHLVAAGAICATVAMLFWFVLQSILRGAGWLASCWKGLSVGFVSIWWLRVASAQLWRRCFGWFCKELGPSADVWSPLGMVILFVFNTSALGWHGSSFAGGKSFRLFCMHLVASVAVCATVAMLFWFVLYSILLGAGRLASCWKGLSACFVSIWWLRAVSAQSWQGLFWLVL